MMFGLKGLVLKVKGYCIENGAPLNMCLIVPIKQDMELDTVVSSTQENSVFAFSYCVVSEKNPHSLPSPKVFCIATFLPQGNSSFSV